MLSLSLSQVVELMDEELEELKSDFDDADTGTPYATQLCPKP